MKTNRISREECENKLLEKAKEMYEIYKQYNSIDEYLGISMFSDYISISNGCCAENYSLPIIDVFVLKGRTIRYDN